MIIELKILFLSLNIPKIENEGFSVPSGRIYLNNFPTTRNLRGGLVPYAHPQWRSQKFQLGGLVFLPFFPFLSLSFPFCPFPFCPPPFTPLLFFRALPFFSPCLPLEVGPLKIQPGGLGERCELPQRGLGRNPNRNRIRCILASKDELWWQQF